MKPIGMLQTLVILYIDLYTGLKIPGMFVTLNSKTQVAHEIIFNEIKQIITVNGTMPMLMQTYTIEYEKAHENALKLIFPSQRRIGCFFHYTQYMVRLIKTNGFGKKEYKIEAQEIVYLLATILFKYKSNMEYVYSKHYRKLKKKISWYFKLFRILLS